MTPFTTLTGKALPMPIDDIDTDIIYPARFLLRTSRTGLGEFAFREWRFDANDRPREDFVLNDPRWQHARILVAGANFGCGSSREQAPWALADLGLRCIVAPSFGEIFRDNCYANGLLPITLCAAQHAVVMAEAEAAEVLDIDLAARMISLTDGRGIGFEIDEGRRQSLLNGWDEIDVIRRRYAADIAAYAEAHQRRMPWLDAPVR